MKLEREGALGALLVVVLLAGLAFDAFTDEADAGRTSTEAPIFDERSVYCPPPPFEGESTSKLVVGTASGDAVPVGIDDGEQTDLPAGRILRQKITAASALVGYGGEVLASTLTTTTGRVSALAAARCSKTASTRWYFAEGSSSLGADERIVIYNPFPDEAVVGVSLFTPDGQQGNANLSDGIAVPSGETTVIELNKFIRQERAVAAVVEANRGRVIAWRAMEDRSEERPDGFQMTLGATATSSEWYLPEGAVDGSTDMRVSLLNPTEEEAVASISLPSGKETIQPPELVEVVVPPRTMQRIALRNFVGGSDRNLGGAGVIVRTTSGELIAERTVYYDSDDLSGIASEVGAARTSAEWYLGPAVEKPDRDHVVLLNPGASLRTVSLSLLGETEDLTAPDGLQSLKLQPGTQLRVSLARWSQGGTYSVRVVADGDVVAERVAADDSDVASVMGVPLVRPTEQ